MIIGLVLTLGALLSWGAAPPNNDVSDNGNTAGGTDALANNTTGTNNTAFGDFALLSNTTGSSNTASGHRALLSNTSGQRNTASGFDALLENTTGIRNTAVGVNALRHTTASDNIAVGLNAGIDLTTGANNIAIGNRGEAGEANTIRVGSAVQTQTFIAGINGAMVNNGVTVLINADGQLGTVVSSARYKHAIRDMGAQSRQLGQLRPVTFQYKQDPQGERHYGLIAEEVAQVYPELVTRGAEGQVEAVQYHELIPLLLNELQHQQQELVELRAQNESLRAALKQRDEEQRAQNAALAARLAQLEEVTVHASALNQTIGDSYTHAPES